MNRQVFGTLIDLQIVSVWKLFDTPNHLMFKRHSIWRFMIYCFTGIYIYGTYFKWKFHTSRNKIEISSGETKKNSRNGIQSIYFNIEVLIQLFL